jgi:hypothetical protein
MNNPRGMVGKVDLATKNADRLDGVLANSGRCVGTLHDADDGGDGEVEIFLEIGSKGSKRAQDTQLRRRSTIAQVAFKDLKHEGEKRRQMHFELPLESQSDRFDQVDYYDLKSRARIPEFVNEREDRRKVIANMLLDH